MEGIPRKTLWRRKNNEPNREEEESVDENELGDPILRKQL